MKKMIIKKRSFLLLEILIALFLIGLLAVPLTRNPLYFYKKEMTDLEELTLLEMKKEAFFEIKQMLFKNEIPWEEFTVDNDAKAPIRSLPSKVLTIKGFKQNQIAIYYRIWTIKEKPCQNEILCRKVGVQIALSKDLEKDEMIFKKTYPNEKDRKNNTYIIFAQKKKEPLNPL